MSYPLVTIMAGNTHTTCVGWSREGAPGELARWKTHAAQIFHEDLKLKRSTSPNPYAPLQKLANAATKLVLAGVTPAYQADLKIWLQACGYTVLLFRSGLPAPLEIVPVPPEKVGDDRVAAVLGAWSLDRQLPAVVVDSGTALTINALTPAPSKGQLPRFEGGLIMPGQDMMLGALNRFAKQLPRLEPIAAPSQPNASTWIGRSTEEAMTWGAWHAYVSGAVAAARAQHRLLGSTTRVLLTGGGAQELLPLFKSAFGADVLPELNANLVHLGLYAAYRAVTP
jgi:pantothenate kinase type III